MFVFKRTQGFFKEDSFLTVRVSTWEPIEWEREAKQHSLVLEIYFEIFLKSFSSRRR